MGLPLAASGNFAIAYRLTCGEKQYAVRLFTRKVDHIEARYAAISAFLQSNGGHVTRGGNWNYSMQIARVAFRDWWAPSDRSSDLGFRLARRSYRIEE